MTKYLTAYHIAAFLIVSIAVLQLFQLGVGEISRYDEYLTLDRTNGFLQTGDWLTVYGKNLPDFKKPPLQYWFGAVMMLTGMDIFVALKIPSWFFAVLCLIGTLAIVREIAPRHSWAGPAAVLFLASSNQFWSYAQSAMLETGSAAFVTFALLFALKGLRNGAYWWACAAMIALGALQKSPAALLFVAVLVFGAATGARVMAQPNPGLRLKIIVLPAVLAVVSVGAWLLLQLYLHGAAAIQVGLQGEMIERFVPAEESGLRGLGKMWVLIIRDEPLLRLAAFVAAVVLPFRLHDARVWGLTAVLMGFTIGILFAGGAVYSRYTLNLLPLMCALTAVLIFQVLSWTPRRKWIVAGLVSLTMMGPIKLAILYGDNRPGRNNFELTVLPHVGAALRENELLIACAWRRKGRVSPGGVSYFASNGRPFLYSRGLEAMREALRGMEPGRPLRGICRSKSLDDIRDDLGQLQIISRHEGDYVHFTARAK